MIQMENKRYKLGSRDSPLAMWQARKVQDLLSAKGMATEIVAVKSEGDLDLVTPLYAMGVQGVFTKTLDAYLLSGHIDLAVHSMKDVPVQPAQGIIQAAVPERASSSDVIVWKSGAKTMEELEAGPYTIGTGSVRRRSFWLHRFPHHQVENLRGNIQTRLRKLEQSDWAGAVFARAGLERMEMTGLQTTALDWMLPAPAQGALMVVCREEDAVLQARIGQIDHIPTSLCVLQERSFLSALHGGCSTPIGAHAEIREERMYFKGSIVNVTGREMMQVEEDVLIDQAGDIGQRCAQKLLDQGAGRIVAQIRHLQ